MKVSTPHALGANNYVEDRETGELKRPHHINLKTGMSRGRQVIAPKEDEGSTKRRNLRAIEPPLRPLTPLRGELPRGGAMAPQFLHLPGGGGPRSGPEGVF